MSNNKIKQAYDSIKPDFSAKVRVLEEIKRRTAENDTFSNAPPKANKRFIMRPIIALATTAAVLFFFIFGQNLFTPDVNNSFSLIAFAVEMQTVASADVGGGTMPTGTAPRTDGTVELREVDIDLMNRQGSWGGFFDGENLFLNIALGVVGENIQSIEFRTDVGFFAKQYITRENGVIVFPTNNPSIITDSRNVALFGTDFEILGDRFTIRAEEMTEDLLFFIGEEWDNTTRPRDIVINATATFNDGSTQSENITLVFAGRTGHIVGSLSDRVPEFPSDFTPRDPRDSLEERIRWMDEQGESIPPELIERRETVQRPPERPESHNQEAVQRPERPEIPAYVYERREAVQGSELPERNATQPHGEWTREQLEERVRSFEERGIAVPQDLLDMLAEMD